MSSLFFSTSREDQPPTANIKPIASPATAVSKPSPHSSGSRMTASIRPIAVTPTTSTSVTMAATPTATVMPQSSNVPSDQGEHGFSYSDCLVNFYCLFADELYSKYQIPVTQIHCHG